MTDKLCMITTWEGRNIETMTRDELLEVVREMAADSVRKVAHEVMRGRDIQELLRRGPVKTGSWSV